MRGIGIVVANYNYGKYIDECIASCFNQILMPVKVVIVDDASTDNSRDVISHCKYDLEKIFLPTNLGSLNACRVGINVLRNFEVDGVIFLDADDTLTPNAIADHVGALSAQGVVASQGGMKIVSIDGHPMTPQFLSGPWGCGDFSAKILREGRIYPFPYSSGMAWRMDAAYEILHLATTVRNAKDGFLHTMAPLFGLYAQTNSIVAIYRIHDSNIGIKMTPKSESEAASIIAGLAEIDVEKLRVLSRYLKEKRSMVKSPNDFFKDSLVQYRRFYAFKLLGAALPSDAGEFSLKGAWKNAFHNIALSGSLKNLIWLFLLTVFPFNFVRRMLLARYSRGQLGQLRRA